MNVRNAVKESDTQIYAIGIVDSYYSSFSQGRSGRAVLEEMTEVTGGKAYFPNSVYELEDICVKIALELKNQYVLGYSSTNPAKDGRWRKIKVKLNAPKRLLLLSPCDLRLATTHPIVEACRAPCALAQEQLHLLAGVIAFSCPDNVIGIADADLDLPKLFVVWFFPGIVA